MVAGSWAPSDDRGDAMSELEIPERAWDAMSFDNNQDVNKAMRIVVAAELRRINESDECWCHECIRDRADELDPPNE
jgi:hypothetical protein